MQFSKTKWGLIILFLLYWIYTFVSTKDMQNWVIENLLVFIFVGFFLFQQKFFKHTTTFSFACLFVFVMLHISGSQYAYTHHPVGIWMKDAFHLKRNGFDRLVHFSFGLLISVPLQEFIQYKTKLTQRVSATLSILWICTMAGVFELLEWIIGGVFFPESGTDYVGTQGDVWDAQKDMALAMIASCAVVLLYNKFYRKK